MKNSILIIGALLGSSLASCNQDLKAEKSEVYIHDTIYVVDTISTIKTEPTWIGDFREFRDAVYQGNRPKLSGFLDFPLSSNFLGDINEEDFDKYYDDFFNEAFISRILKVKSQIVYDDFYYKTEEIIIDELTYSMDVQYDDSNKILRIRLNDRDSDLESSVLYDFKVIKNKIYLFNIDMAG